MIPEESLAFTGSGLLHNAVCQARPVSAEGARERLFAWLFRGLVYPQIWEDPELDLKALALSPGARIVTIASGGCNVLSYLTADPAEIVAVDLNRAHVALTRLKLAAVRHLPSHDAFYRFFGAADEPANVAAYRRFLRDRIDDETRLYWEGRTLSGRPRISLFSRGFYRHGLLGRWIGAAHLLAKLYGADPRELIAAATLEEQRRYFETVLAPIFDKPLVRWATSRKMSLFGLGIPPAQYASLREGGASMAAVLRARLEKLACAFSLSDNYFAWQAFARAYPQDAAGPLPLYLRRANFDAIRARAERVRVINGSLTEVLAGEPTQSFDAFVLLDAQDWMTDAQLNALWSAITRSARAGARIVFRTAAEPTLLPGRLDPALLQRWAYEAEKSAVFGAQDRSSIYGGFHLYVFNG